MSASRIFWDAIDQAKRKRREAEAADVAGLDCDDHDDDIGSELADREGA